MAILYNEVNYNNLIKNVGESCLSIASCGECKLDKCLIGYSKICITNSLKDKVTYVMDGQSNIPSSDGKIYDRGHLTDSISDLLKQCKSCDKDHFENCLINVLRNCYEILLFGDIQPYKGSTLLYLNNIKNVNSDIANEILSKI